MNEILNKDTLMETEIPQLLDSLSDSLASISAHIRGDKDEWGVKIVPTEVGWMIVSSKDRKPFLEVEVTSDGTVHLRPVSEEETLTYSDSSFSSSKWTRSSASKPPKRTFLDKYSSPLAKKPDFSTNLGKRNPRVLCRSPLWKRDLNIQLCTEESEFFTELCTPEAEGSSNIPLEMTGVWREGTKSRLEEEVL
mmetsp:Transcript_12040/g.22974  ORF Transcript_12040/g.22974 Transcript_12040/m.22974 type:complete len:193 (+) Transcript_12040:82-660(+)